MTLETTIQKGRNALISHQLSDGSWQFPLEADCTITAEYIMVQHFLGHLVRCPAKLYNYLRNRQLPDGGWPLYSGGPADLSCTVKVYYALKLTGSKADDPYMKAARTFILSNGGAEKSNVFTRILLALFQQVPWDATPWMPMELILLPRWFPFNLSKIAYWSRCVTLPLTVLAHNKAKAKNQGNVNVRELFTHNPWTYDRWFDDVKGIRGRLILKLERFAKKHLADRISNRYNEKARDQIKEWLKERANGVDGLGGIFPAIAGMLMAVPYLDMNQADQERYTVSAIRAIEGLFADLSDTETFVQPCISPVWDTAIASLAIQESLKVDYSCCAAKAVEKAERWLKERQINKAGDWADNVKRKVDLPLYGWAFQNRNDYYPDVDDTAMVLMALRWSGNSRYQIDCAATWLSTMQSSNGGYGAFDVDNDTHWINDIPFADHKSMLDPPTADVSGRVLAAIYSEKSPHYSRKKLINYLLKEQEKNGMWYGRWGTNQLWGTWSAVMGLKHVTGDLKVHHALEKTAATLKKLYQDLGWHGGFGESNEGYWYDDGSFWPASSNAFHTSLALLIMCDLYENCFDRSQELYSIATTTAEWLMRWQQEDGTWNQAGHNAPGFPKVFFLQYHGYSQYFPLWALSRFSSVFK